MHPGGSYSLESQGEKFQNLGRSGRVREFFSKRLKSEGKSGKIFEQLFGVAYISSSVDWHEFR